MPSWALLRDKTLPRKIADVEPTTVPVDISGDEALTPENNAFSCSSADEIEEFIVESEKEFNKLKLSIYNWIIIDDRGFEGETCLVCENYDPDEDEAVDEEEGGEGKGEGGKEKQDPPSYRMARVPWIYAWNMFVNLDIANMGFDEWVDEEAGMQDDGAWKYAQWVDDTGDDETRRKRAEALEKAREEGIIE